MERSWPGVTIAPVKLNVPAGLTNVVAIAGGGYHSLALKYDGTVVAWGDNSAGQTNVPAGLSNVVAVAAGGFHSLALKNDGSVVAWGDQFRRSDQRARGLDQCGGHRRRLFAQPGIDAAIRSSLTNPSSWA